MCKIIMLAENFTKFFTQLLTTVISTHANSYKETRKSLYIYIKETLNEFLRHAA